jgi:type IV pilus assembly protein PilC
MPEPTPPPPTSSNQQPLEQMNLAASEPQQKKKHNWFVLQKIGTVEKVFFVQNLAVLIKAGFSLANALETVARQTKQKWFREVVVNISNSVQSGQSFAQALRAYEKIFDPLFINMIEAGEISGKLEGTLHELALQMKKTHGLVLKVRNALAYPTIILIAMVTIGTGMMIFVIPKIIDIYKDTTYALPLVTRIVIAVSDFVLNNGILVVLLLISSGVLFFFSQKQPKIKLFTHRMILRLPIAGNIVREFNIARFSRVFYSLITTDLPIIRAFEIISNTLRNKAYQKLLKDAIPQLERGVSIGKLLSEDPLLFPPTVVEMITVGEQSGALDEMAKDIADHYEEEVSSTLDGLSVLIEPVLMLILGGAVGLIAVAILWPMYNLVNVV